MKIKWQQIKPCVVVAASALALTACGSGSSSSSSSSSSSTPASTVVSTSAKATTSTTTAASSTLETPQAIADGSGTVLTASSTGSINHGNAFFQAFGNGRSCSSCHQEAQGWTVTPAALAARFTASAGTDPIFQLVDGANSPNERVSTLAQKQVAYSMLLSRAVIRVGLPMPTVSEFTLQSVEDPYGFASAQELSLFRRPLPATNLKFMSTVMWDARETFSVADSTGADCILDSNPAQCYASINFDLLDQANSAVKTHAQFAAGLTAAQQQSIVGFESALSTAQASDTGVGSLSTDGASGGPAALAATPYYFGINDVVTGDYRTGAHFNRNVFTLFSAWASPPPAGPGLPPVATVAGISAAQASIGRGEAIFNTRPFTITGVNGFNDVLKQPAIQGTCSGCHDTPNVGSASVPRLMDTGIAAAVLRTPDLPLYTLKNSSTGAIVQTSDPGYALQTGKWQDISKFKVPGLRGLAARPPYFHNGFAPNLAAVVQFYDHRFNMGLSPQEAADLTAFLQAL